MSQHARGRFDVQLTPQALAAPDASETLGRLSITKQFFGDLEGTSLGEMLTAGTALKGSAGYVAVERVTGRLCGRSGSFALQHIGIMDRGASQLAITVVPDSGTDELTGIAGIMTITIVEKDHFYDLEYTVTTVA